MKIFNLTFNLTFILASILFFSVSSFSSTNALAGNLSYCGNESSTVAYIPFEMNSRLKESLPSDAVSFGRLVTDLNDGRSVITSCEYNINKSVAKAIIIDQSQVFTVVHAEPTQKGNSELQIIGVNLKTSTLLIEKTTFKVIKSYFLQHNDSLAKKY